MRHSLFVIFVAIIGFLAPLASVHAEADPSELYLNAYMSVQQAEKLERNNSFKAALSKYRYAGSLLDQIHDRYPDWQSLIVDYRKKKTAEAIAKLEEKLSLEAPPQALPALLPGDSNSGESATPPASGGASPFNPNLIPGVSDEPDLPQADHPPQSRPGSSIPSNHTPHVSDGEPPTDIVDQAARQIRSQMIALKKQLQKSQEELDEVRQEKAKLAGQLDEAVQKLNTSAANASQTAAAASETEKLKEELERIKAESAQAKAQLEQAKTGESELQTKLAEAHEQLKKAQSAPAASEAVKKQIAKIQNALDDARADREVAEEQGEILSKKLAALAQRPDLSKKLAEAEKKAKAAAAENEKLTQAAAEAGKKLATLSEQLDTEKAEKAKISTTLAESQKKAAADLEEAEKKLIAVAKERDAAKSRGDELSTQLETSKKQVATLSVERDHATKERDQALSELTKAKEANGKVEKLLAENGELVKKLDEAQKAIAGFNASAPEKEKEISDLKEKLVQVQEQLTASQKENSESSNSIKDLQAKIDATQAAAAAAQPEEQKKLTEENELLRGIVMRELKDQARREQARKLIVAELGRLQVRSKAINEQVELLSQPVVKLTDKERALFKTPQMEIVDNNSNAMAISIAAPQFDTHAESTAPEPAGGANAAANGNDTGPKAFAPSGQRDTARDSDTSGSKTPTVETANKPNLPPELQPLAQEAKEKFERGKYIEAERDYEKLISKAPTNVYALSNLGVARFRAGKLKLAEETFKKVIALAPQDSFSYATLGIVYYQQSKYDEAVAALTRSLAVNPKNPTAHNYLGVTAAQKGWTEAARKEIETAIQIDPNYADAHFNLAVVLATSQPVDKENARKHYQKAVQLGAETDPALEKLIK